MKTTAVTPEEATDVNELLDDVSKQNTSCAGNGCDKHSLRFRILCLC